MENSRNIFSTLVLEQNPSYVEELEKKYNIELPSIFKAFVQTFEYGKFNLTPGHNIIHSNEDLGYDGFGRSLERDIKIYFNQDEIYTNPQLLPIISSGFYHHGICLSLKNDNIILFKGYEEHSLIAQNILEFITQLREIK